MSVAIVPSLCTTSTVDVTLYSVHGHGAGGACSVTDPVNDLGVDMRCVVEVEKGLWRKEQSGIHQPVDKCG